MNRCLFALISLLLIGSAGSYLYRHHGLAAIHAHLPGSTVAVQPIAGEACGCEADTDEVIPTTFQQIKQAKISKKHGEAQVKIRSMQIALRLRRLVHVGMARTQVTKAMGDAWSGGETPPEVYKGHSAVDSDDYGDYEVAFSSKDTVVWVRPL